MHIQETAIPGVRIYTPSVFADSRGFFLESFNSKHFTGETFVQDNHSCSARNVLRGLHYQITKPQSKLVRVVNGSILDVAVDLRKSSSTFGKSVAVLLSSKNYKQLWVPAGFAHGFISLEDDTEVLYKTTEYWYKEFDRSVRWNCPALNIEWGNTEEPLLSDKDAIAPYLEHADLFE